MITLDTKFDVGDEVWIVGTDLEKVLVCDVCEGNGTLYNKSGQSHKCRNCWGSGEIERDISVPKKTKIDRIDIVVWSDEYRKKRHKENYRPEEGDVVISYTTSFDMGSGNRPVYRTKEEAEKEIKDTRDNMHSGGW